MRTEARLSSANRTGREGAPLRLVVMGVSGTGKSTVGTALGMRLGIAFADADDLHPAANIARMRAGIALTDEDRWPWLDRVAAVLCEDAPIVVACSALKRAYRDHLRAQAGGPVLFIHLATDRARIAARLGARQGHFMPAGLLESQLDTLEAPGAEEAATVDAGADVALVVERIVACAGLEPARCGREAIEAAGPTC